jgi:hypothetical protein
LESRAGSSGSPGVSRPTQEETEIMFRNHKPEAALLARGPQLQPLMQSYNADHPYARVYLGGGTI